MFYLCLLGLFSREERCYVSGRLDGPAKYFYTSGAVETRIYENGALQGISRKFKNEPPRIFFQINFALKAKMRNRYKNVKIRETGQTIMGMEFFARVSRQNLPPIIFLENLNLKIMVELHFHGLQELRFTGLGPSAETVAPKSSLGIISFIHLALPFPALSFCFFGALVSALGTSLRFFTCKIKF